MLRPRQDWYQEELRISRGFCGAAFLERLRELMVEGMLVVMGVGQEEVVHVTPQQQPLPAGAMGSLHAPSQEEHTLVFLALHEPKLF